MIHKFHDTLFTKSSAAFSNCGLYRYALRRVWAVGPLLNYILLNPSTANEMVDDPTVVRCCRRAQKLGFGGMIVTNLFAFRATDPKAMKGAVDPVGPENDLALVGAAAESHTIICGWGAHGSYLNRSSRVEELLRVDCRCGNKLMCLGCSKRGEPRHPLYMPYDIPLLDFIP